MFLYILYSEKSHIYYVGITHNIEKRLQQHNFSTTNSFTASHRPWILKAAFKCKNQQQAAWCESNIKKQKSSAFIEKYLLSTKSNHPLLTSMIRIK